MTVCLILLAVLLLSALSGIVGDIYVYVLTQPGQVLAFWAKWLYSVRDTFVQAVEADPDRVRRRSAFADTMLKPILTCVFCVSGQIGFWLSLYVFSRYSTGVDIPLSLMAAVASVYMSILFGGIRVKNLPENERD